LRRGFTLIEILISVMLISIVILGIAKIREQNFSVAKYLSQRVQTELSNTLFLDKENEKYSKSRKDAMTILYYMSVKKFKTKEILKKIEREIVVSPPLPINDVPIKIELRALMLRDRYSARYYHIY